MVSKKLKGLNWALNKLEFEVSICYRILLRLFNTEACLNGSFLCLPDAHYRTSSNYSGVDLDKVESVMEKLRSCNPKVQECVRIMSFIPCFFFDKTLSLLVIRMCSIHTAVITRNSAMFWSITHILNSSILSCVRKRGIIWKCNSTVCSSCYTFEKDGWWKSSRLLDITYREKICSKNYRSIYLIDEIARHFSTVCSCINLWLLKLLKSTVWAQN